MTDEQFNALANQAADIAMRAFADYVTDHGIDTGDSDKAVALISRWHAPAVPCGSR